MISFFEKKTILFGICFLIAASARGADVFTLPQLLEKAFAESPEMKALRRELEGQESLQSQAGRWDNPVFEIGADRKDEPEGSTNFTRIGVSQPLPRWGRLGTQTDLAASEVEISRLKKESAENRFKFELLKRAYRYKIAAEKSVHAEERVTRFKTVQSYLRSRPFAAPQKKAEAVIVRSKLKVLQQNLRELSAEKKSAWNSLNEFLNFPSEAKIQLSWMRKGPVYQLPDLLQKAETQSPELRESRLRVLQQIKKAELVSYETWPGLTLSGIYSNGVGQKPEKVYGVGLSFPLPVLNSNQGAVRWASANKDAQDFRLEQTKRKLSQSLKSLFEDYEASRLSLSDLSMDEIPEMEKDMNSIDENFKKGQVELMTYLEADTQHVEHLNSILGVQQDFLNHYGELLMLTGQNIEIPEQ